MRVLPEHLVVYHEEKQEMHVFSMTACYRLITVRYFCVYEFALLLVVVYQRLVFALKVKHVRSKGIYEEIKKNSGEKEKELSMIDKKQCRRRSWSKGSEVCEEG